MNDACRHNTMRHEKNRVFRSINIKVLIHESRYHVRCFGTYLPWRLYILNEGDFDEWAEEMDDAIVIVHAIWN